MEPSQTSLLIPCCLQAPRVSAMQAPALQAAPVTTSPPGAPTAAGGLRGCSLKMIPFGRDVDDQDVSFFRMLGQLASSEPRESESEEAEEPPAPTANAARRALFESQQRLHFWEEELAPLSAAAQALTHAATTTSPFPPSLFCSFSS